MKIRLTPQNVTNLKPQDKAYRVYDTYQPGLFIRVLPSGHASYMVTWARNQAATLGRVKKMTLEQARTETAQYLAEAHKHGEPIAVTQGRKDTKTPTLRSFLQETYFPWFQAHHKSHVKTRHAIEYSFATLMEYRLDQISLLDLQSLRSSWLKGGLSASSANRKMASLRGALSRAVEWEYLDANPMGKLRQMKTDTSSRIRYLTSDEEKRLLRALEDRQEKIRAERDSANQWRMERKKELLPDLREVEFVDHLKPLVLLSLNTGMRQGEVFNLDWRDVDLINNKLTVVGKTSKSGQTRYIDLNTKAVAVLTNWRRPEERQGFVFPGQSGERLDNVKKSWAGVLAEAKIDGFRWHDLRHTFASRLVMKNVALNTVRVLLGHSDIKMTLRYAHLAPEATAAAVALL